LYDKKWEYRTVEGSQAMILLDLVITITKKVAHINKGKIIVGNNNRLLARAITNKIRKENQYTVSAGAEIAKIKEVIKSSSINIDIQLIKKHNYSIRLYNEDLLPYLITICSYKLKWIRSEYIYYQTNRNIKYHGYYQLMRENKIITRLIKEGIRVIDAEKMEIEYIKHKYPNYHEIIDF
jgi:hypothetical protein